MQKRGDGKVYFTINIDGPSASGKSSVAVVLSKRLHLPIYDLGRILRMFAYLLEREGISLDSDTNVQVMERIVTLVEKIKIEFNEQDHEIHINGIKFSPKLLSERWGAKASLLSSTHQILKTIESQTERFFNERSYIGIRAGVEEYGNPHSFNVFLLSDQKDRAERRLDQESHIQFLEDIEKKLVQRDKRDIENGALLRPEEIKKQNVLILHNEQVTEDGVTKQIQKIVDIIVTEHKKWLESDMSPMGCREYKADGTDIS